MTIKNNIDLLNTMNMLSKYLKLRLPQNIGYAIMKNYINLEEYSNTYEKALNAIFENYSQFMIRDEEGKLVINEAGIPEVDEEHTTDYNNEIEKLLNTEIYVNVYRIDDSELRYEDDEKYDVMTPVELINLQKLLCK